MEDLHPRQRTVPGNRLVRLHVEGIAEIAGVDTIARLLRVRRVVDRVDELLEHRHLGLRQGVATEEGLECPVEVQERRPIRAPVVGSVGEERLRLGRDLPVQQALEGLGDHELLVERPLVLEADERFDLVWDLERPFAAEIPRKTVSATVDMATRAGDEAVA